MDSVLVKIIQDDINIHVSCDHLNYFIFDDSQSISKIELAPKC